jgi:hypothetical protein
MKVRVQVVIEAEGEVPEVVRDVARWERGRLRPEVLGLSLGPRRRACWRGFSRRW